MGVKMKVCAECGKRLMIGRSKTRCKACRNPDRPKPVKERKSGEEPASWVLANLQARGFHLKLCDDNRHWQLFAEDQSLVVEFWQSTGRWYCRRTGAKGITPTDLLPEVASLVVCSKNAPGSPELPKVSPTPTENPFARPDAF